MLLPTPRPAASREIFCLALFATDTHNGVAADAIALERRLLSGLSVPAGGPLTAAAVSMSGGRAADGERYEREDGDGEGP
ncbi:MAG: hypothetical protein M3P91_01245 [Actinomycetota bacterium]|nr:hypothetical protein [Actinomycetota bacterium]